MATTTIEKELLKLERRYWKALKERDLDTALSLTDDPCIVVGAQGVGKVDHRMYSSMMDDATWEILDFSIDDDVQVRVIGDTAMLG